MSFVTIVPPNINVDHEASLTGSRHGRRLVPSASSHPVLKPVASGSLAVSLSRPPAIFEYMRPRLVANTMALLGAFQAVTGGASALNEEEIAQALSIIGLRASPKVRSELRRVLPYDAHGRVTIDAFLRTFELDRQESAPQMRVRQLMARLRLEDRGSGTISEQQLLRGLREVDKRMGLYLAEREEGCILRYAERIASARGGIALAPLEQALRADGRVPWFLKQPKDRGTADARTSLTRSSNRPLDDGFSAAESLRRDTLQDSERDHFPDRRRHIPSPGDIINRGRLSPFSF